MLPGLKCSCFLWLSQVSSGFSVLRVLWGVLNNVWAQIFSCILLFCVSSLRPMLSNLQGKQAAKHPSYTERSTGPNAFGAQREMWRAKSQNYCSASERWWNPLKYGGPFINGNKECIQSNTQLPGSTQKSMEQTRPHISVYRWVSWMLLGLKCSCFLCWLKHRLASNSWEPEGALNNVEFRSSHVSCSCVFFSLRLMLADLPRKQAAKHSRHSGRSMHARLRTPSCHGGYQIEKLVLYNNLLTIYGILCASSRGPYVQSHVESYVQSYMCIFSWHCCSYVPLLIHMAGERSWLAQRFSLHHVVGRWWGNLLWQASERGYQFYFPKDVFVWALWVSQVFAISCFLLVSLSLLSLIFLLVAATGAVRVLRSYEA